MTWKNKRCEDDLWSSLWKHCDPSSTRAKAANATVWRLRKKEGGVADKETWAGVRTTALPDRNVALFMLTHASLNFDALFCFNYICWQFFCIFIIILNNETNLREWHIKQAQNNEKKKQTWPKSVPSIFNVSLDFVTCYIKHKDSWQQINGLKSRPKAEKLSWS